METADTIYNHQSLLLPHHLERHLNAITTVLPPPIAHHDEHQEPHHPLRGRRRLEQLNHCPPHHISYSCCPRPGPHGRPHLAPQHPPRKEGSDARPTAAPL